MSSPEPLGNPELSRAQHQFNKQMKIFKEVLLAVGASSLRYDVPDGFALSAHVGDIQFGSVAYGDESSRIIHNEDCPVVASNVIIIVGHGECDEISFIGSRKHYPEDETMRIAQVHGGPERILSAVENLSGTIVQV